jgi:hypothetical protein
MSPDGKRLRVGVGGWIKQRSNTHNDRLLKRELQDAPERRLNEGERLYEVTNPGAGELLRVARERELHETDAPPDTP